MIKNDKSKPQLDVFVPIFEKKPTKKQTKKQTQTNKQKTTTTTITIMKC